MWLLREVVSAGVCIAGFTKATPSNFTSDFNPYGVRGIFNGAAIIFFAYLGYDAVATLAEEVRPQTPNSLSTCVLQFQVMISNVDDCPDTCSKRERLCQLQSLVYPKKASMLLQCHLMAAHP